jgi:hypothetical protein
MPGISVYAPSAAMARTVPPEVAMTMPSPQYQAPPPPPKAGYYQRGKDRTAARASAVVESALEPGEQMLMGSRVHSGPSDWWRLIPRVGAFIRFFQRHYFMVLTDRRVIFCGLSYWTARPKNIKAVVPRGQVQVSDYKPGTVWPSFRLGYPGRNKPMKLRAGRVWRPEVEQILGVLGFGGPQQPGLAGAGYQPGAQLPPPGYQPGQQFQAPPQQYQAPPQQHQAPPQQYQAGQQFQAPPQQYQTPPQQYDAPTAQFQPSPQQYQAPPQQYDAPTQSFQPSPQDYQAPQQPGYPPVPPPATGRGRHAGG